MCLHILCDGRWQPASAHGMNFEGMKRRGWSPETISKLRRAYKVVFRESRTLDNALQELDGMLAERPELAIFIDSLTSSTRGITR